MMNQIQRKNPFWSLAGPFFGYLGIQWGVQFAIQFVIQIPYVARAYAQLLREDTLPSTQKITEAVLQAMEPALEAVLKYQVEIAGVSALCTLILTGILFSRDRKLEKACGAAVPEKAPALKYWTIVVFGILGCLAANSLMAMAQMAFYDAQYQETAQSLYAAGVPMQILCLGLAVPLAEELMFRGILFKRFRERRSFWYSALCSAVLFAFMHTNMTQSIYSFLLGLMLAYVYEKFGSFRAPFLLHVVMNCTSVVLTETGVFAWLVMDPVRIACASIAGAFICSVVFVQIQRIGGPVTENSSDGSGTQDRFR